MDSNRINNNTRIQPLPLDSTRKKPDGVETTDGASPVSLSQDTFRSSRVKTADVPGALADAASLKALFTQLLGRAPTDRELTRYVGMDLNRVEGNLKDGLECRVRTYGDAVRNMFNDTLGRVPTDKEMDKFTGYLASGISDTEARKRIAPTLTVTNGMNQLKIPDSNATVGNAPGASKINGDITAMADVDTREFNKGAVISMTREGAKVSQYAQNGTITVQTAQGALICQNPKEKKMTIYTADGAVIEATLGKYQGTDRSGNPTAKNSVLLKVTDSLGNVKLDQTQPNSGTQGKIVEVDGATMQVSTDRTSGAFTDVAFNLPGIQISFDGTGASSIRLGNPKERDQSNTSIKYSPDNFQFTMNAQGHAFYDSTATTPDLPAIPKLNSTPVTPTVPTNPTVPTTPTIPTPPTTPTIPTPPPVPTNPTIPTTLPQVDPTPSPLDPPTAQTTTSDSGGMGDLIETAGNIANSVYQSTKGAAPIAAQLKTIFAGSGSAAADAAVDVATDVAIDAAAIASEASESGVSAAGAASGVAKSGFMAGLKGLLSSIGRATMISAAIEGVTSIVSNVFKAYKGEEDAGMAMRNIATDTSTGAVTGGLAALGSGLATVGLTALGVVGWPLTIAAAGAGMLVYWLSRGKVRDLFANLFGANKATAPASTATTTIK